MENKEVTRVEKYSEQYLEELKAKHGALVMVEVKFGEKKCVAIFKEPDFKTLEAITSISKKDDIKGIQVAWVNCIVEADQEFEQRDVLKLKAVEGLMNRIQQIQTEVKNL